MPKPIFGDNGSGMHVHQSIWKGGKPTFAGNKYADLSQECLWYIGGIIKHAKSLNAFTNPSTNSYKRLVPGYEAPVLLAYSARNRSASCRIPYTSSPKAKRVEVRFPDPMANPYLAFAAMLMAGLDGIANKIDPGAAMDKDLYDLPPRELKKIPTRVRLAPRGARQPGQGSQLPEGRRRVQRRLHRQLYRAEDARRHEVRDDAAPGRVCDVLLLLSASAGVQPHCSGARRKGALSKRPFFNGRTPAAADRVSSGCHLGCLVLGRIDRHEREPLMSHVNHTPISVAYEESENAGTNSSANPTMGEIIAERFSRRDMLRGALAVAAIGATASHAGDRRRREGPRPGR